MPPKSKTTVNEVQKKFKETAVDLQKFKRQGDVVLARFVYSRIGKASNPKENIDWTIWGSIKEEERGTYVGMP